SLPRYASLTRYGASVAAVPRKAIIIRRSNIVYHYYDGLFYRPSGNQYIVVRPVVGVRLKTLPARHVKVMTPRGRYYYYYGNYYRQKGTTYEVVAAPKGAMVDALPEGYDVKEVDGTEYYVWNDTYYQEVDADEFESGIGYEVVDLG
ncbi:MAG: DUF6515 family protein, partial [Bacteroidota bacterium]